MILLTADDEMELSAVVLYRDVTSRAEMESIVRHIYLTDPFRVSKGRTESVVQALLL